MSGSVADLRELLQDMHEQAIATTTNANTKENIDFFILIELSQVQKLMVLKKLPLPLVVQEVNRQ